MFVVGWRHVLRGVLRARLELFLLFWDFIYFGILGVFFWGGYLLDLFLPDLIKYVYLFICLFVFYCVTVFFW